MTAPSPGIVACAMENAHYPSLEAYVMALAEALRVEYEAIVAAGLVLQIDAPDLAMERHTLFAERPLDDFLAFVELVVRALDHALARVPPDRVRLHVCWGNYEGPHDADVPLEAIVERIYRGARRRARSRDGEPAPCPRASRAGAVPPPAAWTLVAGVIDTTTNYVEHPEVVAERIEQAAAAVGDPRRVLAGTTAGSRRRRGSARSLPRSYG
jgi:5-methyltetrahydropteroyltriglutamate--homocysteine methyltransferase